MTIHPIFYRHWLELRYRLLGAAIVSIVTALFYALFIHGTLDWFRQTGNFAEEVRGALHLLPEMGPERLIVWGVHVHLISIALMIAVVALADWKRVDPWTLALPVSRARIHATRLLASWTGTFAACLLLCGLNVLTLALVDEPIPWADMLATTFVVTVIALPVFALRTMLLMSGVLTTIFTLTLPFLAIQIGGPNLRELLLHPGRAWLAAVIALPLTAIFFVTSQWLARQRDL